MKIKIKDKELELNFGIRALEKLDALYPKYKVNDELEIGSGIQHIIADYSLGDLTSIAKLIFVGTLTTTPVSLDEAANLLDEITDVDELDLISKTIVDFFLQAPALTYRMKKMGQEEMLEEFRKEIKEA